MKKNILTQQHIAARIGLRPGDANKGSSGHGLLLGGSKTMPGAALMSAAAALRGGIGTLKVMCPLPAAATLSQLPEAMVLPLAGDNWASLDRAELQAHLSHATALAIGPGMGRERETDDILRQVLAEAKPTVIDADGLFALSRLQDKAAVLHENAVVTPHFGEMARLCGCSIAEVKERQETLALKKAEEWGCTVLLKGHESVIAAPDGRFAWNVNGNAGLAKGGSGDVLSGIALAMLGQKLSPFDAACAAAYLLGASADAALSLLKERMLMARDVTEMVKLTLESSVYRPETQ